MARKPTYSWPTRDADARADFAPLTTFQTAGTGMVYFLGDALGERIKIGRSNQPKWKRINDHRRGDSHARGGDFTVLAVVRCANSRDIEQRIIQHFAEHLVNGAVEVFHADPLIPYITWLRDLYFVSTSREEFEAEQGQAVVDPQSWIPSLHEKRESTRVSEPTLFSSIDKWDKLPSRVVTGDDWYTPDKILDVVRVALGGEIDLDPASHVFANVKVQARRYFTKDENGLHQPWAGHVFLNPPFSDWRVWVNKVLHEWARGEVVEMVILGATRTLTAQYFEPLLRAVDAFCIISGRNAFWGINTESDSPTDGHFLLYIGPNRVRFVNTVSSLGAVWETPEPLIAAPALQQAALL